MEWCSYKTGTNDEGRRIDRIIRKFLPDLSLSLLYREIRKGSIRVNGKKVSPVYRIAPGDTLDVSRYVSSSGGGGTTPRTEGHTAGSAPPLDVIFENEHILAINKPYDIPVHAGGSSPGRIRTDSLDARVLAYSSEKIGASLSFRPGPLHRLDRKTTGIIVFSRSLTGAQWFSEAIRLHCVDKIYLGIAAGHVETPAVWKDVIRKDVSSAFVTVRAADDGDECETEATPLLYGSGPDGTPLSLVRYRIITGKTHQIRFQTSAHGYPLWGDSAYNGGTGDNRGGQDFFLHALQLGIPADNPLGLPRSLCAPLPNAFSSVLKRCFSCPEEIKTKEFTANFGISCYTFDMDFKTSGNV